MHMKKQAIIRRFAQNTKGRDFVVGDLHGHLSALLRAMQQVGFDGARDRLFLTGDLIDRGDHSRECIDLLRLPGVYSVLGNHDVDLLDICASKPSQEVIARIANFFAKNGTRWWADTTPEERAGFVEVLSELPLAIEIETTRGTVGIIHGDVPAGMTWDQFVGALEQGYNDVIECCLTGRDRLRRRDTSGVRGIGRVFVGHTPQWEGVTRLGNVYGIDTGAVFGLSIPGRPGVLTLADVQARTTCLAEVQQAVEGGYVRVVELDTEVPGDFGNYVQEPGPRG